MKEYLRHLAAGNFIYNEPQLMVSDNRIEARAVAGGIENGSFTISADTEVTGLVWSSNERVTIVDNRFCGKECQIQYRVNAVGLKAKEQIDGTFDIISNAGQYTVPYEFKIVQESCKICGADAGNIFHFANMVQLGDEEAEKVFVSDSFKAIFLSSETYLRNIYELLSKSKDIPVAIEELLIAAHKKMPVTVEISQTVKCFKDIEADMQDSISFKKSGWGYVDIDVSTDSQFIKLSAHKITREQFTGNYYDFSYLIDYDKLHYGRNYGRITFKTYNQLMACDIEVICDESRVTLSASEEAENIIKKDILKEKRAAMSVLTEAYLDFRMKKNDTAAWLTKSNRALDRIRGIDRENVYFKLVQAQFCFLQQRQQEGEWLLESAGAGINAKYNSKNQYNVELYSYYLYVKSLSLKDEQYTARAAAKLKEYYENGYDTWRILWLLFYLDKSYGKNASIKLSRIKDLCHNGCASPVMYMEAISIMNSQPALVRVLNSFEMRVLEFGCKNNLITQKLAVQVAELISNERRASLEMISLLQYFYEKFGLDELLTPLIVHMIRNGLTGKEYFALYEKAVLRGLRITRLYECYIMSIDKSRMQLLPKMVLMYFAYDTNLDYADKAYIYANVLINEIGRQDVMKIYMPNIEHFGYEQLKDNKIDDNLLTVYKNIWNEKFIDASTAEFMLKLMFTYKVTCFESDVNYVLVKHKELNEIQRCRVVNGTAYVQMYTDNCAIVFENVTGVLRKDSLQYEVERVFDDEALFEQIASHNSDNIYLNLYLYENRKKYQLANEDICDIVLYLLGHDNVDANKRYKLNAWLIDYYYLYYSGDNFAEAYSNVEATGLDMESAVKLIELCITQGMYDKAFELIKVYGFSRVNPVKLFKFIRRMLETDNEPDKSYMTALCHYIFVNKKYDESVLRYLVDNYNGTNEQMYEVWRACNNFNVDTQELAERIIAQMLFTKDSSSRMSEVFGDYWTNGGRRLIIRAYITYYSYMYFVKNIQVDDVVFKALYQQLLDDNDLSDICSLALLKNYSVRVSELTREHINMAQYIINRLCREDKIFDFYKNFKGVLEIPYNAIDKTVVEFCSKPDSKVEIHYTKGQHENVSGKEHTEIMKGCFGVYTKSFTLFYGESLRYYFVTEENGERKCSEEFNLLCNNVSSQQLEGRFDCINDMLVSRELHDMATMRKLMHGYCVQDYVVNQLFKPIERD